MIKISMTKTAMQSLEFKTFDIGACLNFGFWDLKFYFFFINSLLYGQKLIIHPDFSIFFMCECQNTREMR